MANLNFTSPGYITVCQQALSLVVRLVFNVIYAAECSFARTFVDILSDARKTCLGSSRDMSLNQDEIIRICENPLQEAKTYEVWKRREKLGNVDYRSRRKTTNVETKLKSYNSSSSKADSDKKLKDTAIDYTYIDEYCKVSAPKPSEEEDFRPTELKTKTAFGRSKMPFEKFARQHIGGGIVDCTPTQPGTCHQVHSRNRNVENSYETAIGKDYFEPEDVSVRCCGLNVETAVDYCTCMFCVKGLFYHCMKDSCPENELVDPCSCSPMNRGCVTRWTVLGVLSIFLPCLFCYPLCRGCTEVDKWYKRGESVTKGRRSRSRTVQNRERERLT